jgi:CRISPR-associated protein Csx17
LKLIENSTATRFGSFRNGIREARPLLKDLASADATVRRIKDESKKIRDKAKKKALKASKEYKERLAAADKKFASLKIELIPKCRTTWRGSHLEWFTAAVVLDNAGETKYPALLGTGGNDGNLDFTNNFMQRLADLFDLSSGQGREKAESRGWLEASLYQTISQGILQGAAVGQYLPGAAGGANSTTGADGKSTLNPWDYVLMMEGAVLFSSSATKRMNAHTQVQASAPFALRSNAAYGGTTSAEDESARGEQWMPLWERPLLCTELKALMREGRIQAGREQAAKPVDMARAIARLGVARGITSFQRFGYLERNGLSNFAVPLSRISVTERPNARLLDDISGWISRLQYQARAKGAPARLAAVERNLSDAVMTVLTSNESSGLWQEVLKAAVAVEKVQAVGAGVKAGPIPKLSPEWALACDDGLPLFRLAMALGSAAADYRKDPLRHHWLALKEGGRFYNAKEGKLAHDVRMVAQGRNAIEDLLAVLQRRVLEGEARQRHPAIMGGEGAEACLSDLAAWNAGGVDTESCVDLARAFMALDWKAWNPRVHRLKPAPSQRKPDEAWMALRLCALPWDLDGQAIPSDPALPRRLEAGDLSEALRLALRRLRAYGIRPVVTSVLASPEQARLWGAALAFPVSKQTAEMMLNELQSNSKEKNHVH